MTTRRDWILGAACAAGAGASFVLYPNKRFSRLGTLKLEKAVPLSVGAYAGNSDAELLGAAEPGSLTARLYDQTVGRRYANPQTGDTIDLLVAHGPEQSNENQLHRPDTCYPAFGYKTLSSRSDAVRLHSGAQVPVRELHLTAMNRIETVIYWARVGDDLPVSQDEQRLQRIRLALSGYIGDGALVRFSMVGSDTQAAARTIHAFIADFVHSLSPQAKLALLGATLAPKA
jgi:EpsI family protein